MSTFIGQLITLLPDLIAVYILLNAAALADYPGALPAIFGRC
jgi:hypothetical protein